MPSPGLGRAVARKDFHPESARAHCDLAADAPIADNAHGPPVQLPMARAFQMRSVPFAASQGGIHARNSNCRLKHGRQDVFGDADFMFEDVAYRCFRRHGVEGDVVGAGTGKVQQLQLRRVRHLS
jgi:hypothetical protein